MKYLIYFLCVCFVFASSAKREINTCVGSIEHVLSKCDPDHQFSWLRKAKTKEAVISIKNGQMYWIGGTWLNGTWENGIWTFGTWENGIWENGTWKFGYWHNGTWKNGTWIFGIWTGGVHEGGIWKDGFWEGGTWKGGEWIKGLWNGEGECPGAICL